jgi:tRNA U34 2-thiouridine synthase MnmA/TrmU
LWEFAQTNGAQLFATGHYARVLEHNGCIGFMKLSMRTKTSLMHWQ